ncbi:MAG: hypothetical protein A2381_03420 [Bdellovibrionales bacterium RIFOXYB1_FULL_37_110]|nr:MAG: hypothetical protein A2181_00525 [Bdellovibrionales bacterium RIFOXYA1_FULL_38_20]OFZ48455.1 MAG: hypothetical protein A2417_03910 [Bdellovibrionales bacterium RIFOXYC1_FULL_37_79]OFZ57976.1 MAG: hypothetical protein A2381_03420 [Bdellovibrionales bacterium RIFOXYB1_FULL_37_110]OFZ63113.1 MAG: hypothetical protein A2577_15550 [Bdellovibrionales bacterium RIFOXYD1_FULL_36_51]
MDSSKICRLVKDQLQSMEVTEIFASIEDEDCIRLEIVSNYFQGMRIIKRIELLSKLLQKIAMNELKDYHLIFNPLTINEKSSNVDETANRLSTDGKQLNGIAAQTNL